VLGDGGGSGGEGPFQNGMFKDVECFGENTVLLRKRRGGELETGLWACIQRSKVLGLKSGL
jgi:hypothetical protein